jgi:hypothetical protein
MNAHRRKKMSKMAALKNLEAENKVEEFVAVEVAEQKVEEIITEPVVEAVVELQEADKAAATKKKKK